MYLQILFETELRYFLAVAVLLFFVCFLLFVIVLYKRKQILTLKRNRLKDAEFKNEILEKEVRFQRATLLERQRISKDMHDDFGAGISALKLQLEYLKYQHPELNLDGYVNDLIKSCDNLTHSMREILWSLNSNKDSLESVVNYITVYAINFFDKSNIKPHIENNGYSDQTMGSEKRRSIYLCVKEALNNVYKHSKAENVYLSFEQIENKFIVDVSDDGVGLPADHSNGNGFGNMKSRITSFDGDFQVIENKKGLHLRFVVPLIM